MLIDIADAADVSDLLLPTIGHMIVFKFSEPPAEGDLAVVVKNLVPKDDRRKSSSRHFLNAYSALALEKVLLVSYTFMETIKSLNLV